MRHKNPSLTIEPPLDHPCACHHRSTAELVQFGLFAASRAFLDGVRGRVAAAAATTTTTARVCAEITAELDDATSNADRLALVGEVVVWLLVAAAHHVPHLPPDVPVHIEPVDERSIPLADTASATGDVFPIKLSVAAMSYVNTSNTRMSLPLASSCSRNTNAPRFFSQPGRAACRSPERPSPCAATQVLLGYVSAHFASKGQSLEQLR